MHRARESDFIETLSQSLNLAAPKNASSLRVGPGDDCAVVDLHAGTLVTTDMLMDGVHFLAEKTSPALIGRKAAAVNLSDIAAMGGRPTGLQVALALPRGCGAEWAEKIMSGVRALADEFETVVTGGDTNAWPGPLVICITAFGQSHPQGPVLRSGARAGDLVMVSGSLGGSLHKGRHLTFTPRCAEARLIVEKLSPTSMIDLSDGLATDAGHIAKSSDVTITLDSHLIPIHDDVPASWTREKKVTAALTDGEDFELCFTIEASKLSLAKGLGFSPIGRVDTAQEHRLMLDDGGKSRPVQIKGWSHNF
jgi:thiamine-monophosphate kinase